MNHSRLTGAFIGATAAGVALGAGEVAGGLGRSSPSLVVEVGDFVIDWAPAQVVSQAISLFGTSDKVALVIGIVIASLLLGAWLGVKSLRRPLFGVVGFALFGVFGAFAAERDPQIGIPASLFVAVVATAAGIAALLWLRSLVITEPGVTAEPAEAGESAPEPIVLEPDAPPLAGRRRLLVALGVSAVGAAAMGVLGRRLNGRFSVAAAREAIVVPPSAPPATTTTVPLVDAAQRIAGLTSYITPNDKFYRIDTALQIPQVDPDTWELRITGMVDRPQTYTFEQLLARELVDETVTLTCVSNKVGGNLIGNAKWRGVPLAELLEEAGVQDGATQIVGESVDGFTVGFPTDIGLDGRPALVALAMNDEPLPISHGFPARLVVSGLYGYVSATKWLSEIRLTTLEDFDGYWIPRGWAKEGPIKTQSRIDVPRASSTIPAGESVIAGVAWAQNRGVSGVEVQVDDGPWQQCELDGPESVHAWRQWTLPWVARPGTYKVQVRATDADGVTQTGEIQPPRPDGATGWHRITVHVEDDA